MDSRTTILQVPAIVQTHVGFGTTSCVGDVGNNRVLKFPRFNEDWKNIQHEAKIYAILGFHKRILKCFGLEQNGLLLEKAAKGTLRDLLRANEVSIFHKRKWSLQLVEAVAYIHCKKVIHCDISPRNCFLSETLDLMLGDFQGNYTDREGQLRQGCAAEEVRCSLPDPVHEPDQQSDLFAVGSTIYEIFMGHEPFPELEDEKIEERYRAGQFPDLSECIVGDFIGKCWRQQYRSAEQCIIDLSQISS